MNLTSKEILIQAKPEQVFQQIADCNHLKQGMGLANVPQMSELQCSNTSCSFQMAGLGKIILSITQTTFPTQVVYDVKNEHIKSVSVFFNIAEKGEETALYCNSELDVPFFMSQMLKPVILNFMNILVDCVKTTTEKQA